MNMDICDSINSNHWSVVLILFLAVLSILSHTCVSWFLKLMISLSSQRSDKLGLNLELGSFAAGMMISTTDLAQHTLEQVEPTRNFFAALFLASIGMLIHVHFLWNHVDTLLASVLLVIIVKTIVITIVVKGFGYNYKTSCWNVFGTDWGICFCSSQSCF